ncbi:MAG: helical backbone metal receptor [Bacteroidota bacterium]|nr:helical backbone metal receptor [Bacteroidota bacterium]
MQNPKFQIKDDAGVEVGFDSLPKRIISLAPNITESLYAIGADSVLVGITDLCDFPPEAKTKTKTGSYLSPDYERMVSLKPDLIIMNVENVSNPTYQALKNMGMKIFVSNAKDINGILKMLGDFGHITGRKATADTLLRRLGKENHEWMMREYIQAKTLILISTNPLMTTNGKTFINEIARYAGLHNLYTGESIEYPSISYEDVISKDPYFIVFPTDTNDAGKKEKYLDEIKRQLKNTTAVKFDKIIFVDENIMFRPGPRFLEAIEILHDKFVNINSFE